ncbi:hybrid sensor histidine kinase/response regulator [Candidatus Nitronereus thalassa]|uniref:histidine kinase n=1 Tax=Candidatus Nitronereus thalassa TaxID=3020898 RepID=A0ABU3KB50_9BACT|nr:hybrid sensor histidine kinase/response regulator [Candidatus Nitronereus thalassa]MDT7043639.1 hybrid sensor histidine kinase/response regulator [Candidatus Nitronereus thalassa]
MLPARRTKPNWHPARNHHRGIWFVKTPTWIETKGIDRTLMSASLAKTLPDQAIPTREENSSKDFIRILLVEDDEDDYILTRDALAEISSPLCSLDWAPTFETGLDLVNQDRHDLYLFDYRLGVRTGLELLRQGIAQGCDSPIILLTGSGGELVAAEALRLGAADYMTKNLMTTKSLHRAITNALEKSQLRQTLADHQHRLEHSNQVLTKQNQEIQRFYHTLAHELKTPLTAAREFTAIMLDELAGPLTPEQREYLQISQECLGQITNQVNDLLDITRLDTGKLSINCQQEDMGLLLSHAVTAMNTSAQHKSVAIALSVQPNPLIAWIDHFRMTQVITNLLNNAIKFTPPGGTITLSACEDPDKPENLRISVQDSGCGIAPEHLDHIFDRLYQVEEGHARKEGGLGLGLTISREIVILHGGQINVQSQMGHGTKFTLTLPKNRTNPISHRLNQGVSREVQNTAC